MKKTIAKKLLLATMGLAFGLGISEVVLRIRASAEEKHVPRKQFEEASDPAGTFRMAVLGGSTSDGSPYSNVLQQPRGNTFNLLSAAAFLLEQRLGVSSVKIDNYAGSNWSAETTVNHYFERVGARPDVLVLYTGQNETTQYYTPNMKPPPAVLAPLARLQAGSLLLRRMFTRQVTPGDHRYTGKFFSDNIIPPYEREHSLLRYRRSVERLIRHARDEDIFLVIMIPQSNYLFPPTRSVYQGPAGRKDEALRMFKQAWKAYYLDNQPDQALALLEELRGFCSFADLFYALGEIHYLRNDYETALPYFRKARETDGFPICITPSYRDILFDLVNTYDVPHIDMDVLIRDSLGHPVPDYASFLDDCHLYPDVYLALSRDLIQTMRSSGVEGLPRAAAELNMTREEWSAQFGITPVMWLNALLWESNYHLGQADYSYVKLGCMKQAQRYLKQIAELAPKPLPEMLVEELQNTADLIQEDYGRMREWVLHEGPLPIGPMPEDEDRTPDFGGGADLAASQGDALQAHGQLELSLKYYEAALAADPKHMWALTNLGGALVSLQRFEEGIEVCERALEIEPENATVRRNLGMAFMSLKRHEHAVVHFREAVRSAPDDQQVLTEFCIAASALGWRLATSTDPAQRDGERAVALAEEVCRITGNTALEGLDVLAAAYAETGRFEEAVPVVTRALELARQHKSPVSDAIARRLAAYQEGRPWREE